MAPENPEALITIIIAGIGYGIYIGGEALQRWRLAKQNQYRLPQIVTLFARYVGGTMMILSVMLYVFYWAANKV